METQEAVRVIRALADGTNPATGEELDLTSVCRLPLAVKALNRALTTLVAQYDRERNRPVNAFRHWTPPEDQQICGELRQGLDLHQIARTHNRTVGAIVARLVKLGKIAPASPQKTPAQKRIA